MKMTAIMIRLLYALMGLVLLSGPALALEKPRVTIVYPRDDQQIAAVDSEFVVGQALGAARLWINGVPTKLFDSGAFLGWIPVRPGHFLIEAVARNAAGETKLQRMIQVPIPARTTPQDSLRIETDRRLPDQDVWLMPGDLLEVKCRTSPRSEVFFSIPGVVEQVQMTELPALEQPLFGGNAFRQTLVPDSLRLSGVYYGAYRIGQGEQADSVRIVFRARNRVALLDIADKTEVYATDSVRYSIDSTFVDLFSTDSSAGRVTILDDRFPYVAKIKDSVIVARVGPGLGYFWPFQPAGTKLEVTGRKGPWVRMRAAPYQDVWAYDTSLIFLPHGLPVPKGTVNYTRIDGYPDRTEVRLLLTQQLAYQITETIDPAVLKISVYGATSDIDWIRYDADDVLVDYADWRQPEPGLLEYFVHLNLDRLWGYDSYYDGNTLVVAIRKPPEHGRDLRGLKIVIDPGHSPDRGSVGPTGLAEKDANLWISKQLKSELEHRGAIVHLTRTGGEDLPLYDRPIAAREAGADLFVSIHNNALPDGVNPWENHGVSTYYYYPSSKDLADGVLHSLLNELEMPSFGLYRANFAVIRPTQYPAILVECAFMIIPEQEAALKTPEFQERVGKAIAEGIEHYYSHALPDRRYEAALDAHQRRRR